MGRIAVSPRHRLRLAACMALALAGSWACGSSTPGGPSPSPSAPSPLDPLVATQLDQAIQATLRDAGVPGAIVGVWTRDGSYEKAFGVADRASGSPMRTDLYMRMGSETKTFTVTAVLQLVDQGRVGLDDPISKYVDRVPGGDRITVRQLARMTSGLFNYSADDAFITTLFDQPHRAYTPGELLGYSFAHPLQFDPGTQLQYCNTNTVLLGLLVEKVSGQSLPDYLRQHVFEPLHLDHTSFPTDSTYPDPHAHGYTESPSGAPLDATDWNPSWGWAAGAMVSTLDDLRVWDRSLATGGLVSASTQAQRLQTVSPAPGASFGYGLGLFNVAGWIGHNGSLPGFQSLTVYLPSQEASLVILANTDVSAHGEKPSELLGNTVTRIISPGNVISFGPSTE